MKNLLQIKIFLFAIFLIQKSLQQFYNSQCPQNDIIFAKCDYCYNITHTNNQGSFVELVCGCRSTTFNAIGACFNIKDNCHTYNQWDDDSAGTIIFPFWDQKFTDAQTTQTPPNPLPDFLNNFYFSQYMQYRQQWIDAYYFYKIFQSDINSKSSTDQHKLLFDAVNLVQSTRNMAPQQRWTSYKTFVNSNLGRTYSLQQLLDHINGTLKTVIPCQCSQTYGPGLINSIDQCLRCPSNCYKCSNNATQCLECIEYYVLNSQNTCQLCPLANCMMCNSDGTCNYGTCQSNQRNVNNQCIPCSQNCTSCSSNYDQMGQATTQRCWNCKFPLTNLPTPDGQCVTCDQAECQQCLSNDTSHCLSCTFGYYNNSNSKCAKCPENCGYCPNGNCVFCMYGYNISTVTGQCTRCPAGCYMCAQDTFRCILCYPPLLIVQQSTGKCVVNQSFSYVNMFTYEWKYEYNYSYQKVCRPGCASCYDYDYELCFKCRPTYFMDNSRCKKCPEGCETCFSRTQCKTCLPSYVLLNNICAACPDNCQNCSNTDNTVCITCVAGFEVQNNQCVLSTDPDCLIKDALDSTKCTLCRGGFTVSDLGTCVRCRAGCSLSCNPKNVSECAKNRLQNFFSVSLSDYFFNQEGCLVAINGYCVYPDAGYQLATVNSTVVTQESCLYPCKKCSPTDCTLCQAGFTLSTGVCVPDLTCNPTCPNCPLGTERQSGSNNCVVCSASNCAACLNDVCFDCFPGFFFDGSVCQPCSANCRTCVDAKNCLFCKKGYFKQQNYYSNSIYVGIKQCHPCNSNCLTCVFDDDRCTSCLSGMKLVGNRCFNEYTVGYQYRLNISYLTFLIDLQSEQFLTTLALLLNVSTTDITIQSIREGSTIIGGSVSSASQTNANQILETLARSPLPNYQVIETRFTVLNADNTILRDTNPPKQTIVEPITQPNKNNIGAIIGGVVGGVIAIAICTVIIYKVWKSRHNKSINSQQIRPEESYNANQKTIQQ